MLLMNCLLLIGLCKWGNSGLGFRSGNSVREAEMPMPRPLRGLEQFEWVGVRETYLWIAGSEMMNLVNGM